MSEKDVLQAGINFGVNLMKAMTVDMTDEQFHWNPPGTAHSVAATYAHAALSTDWLINSYFQGKTAHYESDWASKTGVSEPAPLQTLEWAQGVRVNRPVFQEYAEAIYNETLAYCDGLSQSDMERMVDMSMIGAGQQPLRWCLSTVIVGHLNQLAGEIAAVKGMQGLQGYPG